LRPKNFYRKRSIGVDEPVFFLKRIDSLDPNRNTDSVKSHNKSKNDKNKNKNSNNDNDDDVRVVTRQDSTVKIAYSDLCDVVENLNTEVAYLRQLVTNLTADVRFLEGQLQYFYDSASSSQVPQQRRVFGNNHNVNNNNHYYQSIAELQHPYYGELSIVRDQQSQQQQQQQYSLSQVRNLSSPSSGFLPSHVRCRVQLTNSTKKPRYTGVRVATVFHRQRLPDDPSPNRDEPTTYDVKPTITVTAPQATSSNSTTARSGGAAQQTAVKEQQDVEVLAALSASRELVSAASLFVTDTDQLLGRMRGAGAARASASGAGNSNSAATNTTIGNADKQQKLLKTTQQSLHRQSKNGSGDNNHDDDDDDDDDDNNDSSYSVDTERNVIDNNERQERRNHNDDDDDDNDNDNDNDADNDDDDNSSEFKPMTTDDQQEHVHDIDDIHRSPLPPTTQLRQHQQQQQQQQQQQSQRTPVLENRVGYVAYQELPSQPNSSGIRRIVSISERPLDGEEPDESPATATSNAPVAQLR
jgi:hypothetical protein